MKSGRVSAVVVMATILAVLSSSCAQFNYPVEYNEALGHQIGELAVEVESEQLANMTGFEWQYVYVFSNFESADEINAKVGERVMKEGESLEDGACIFVFTKGDRVSRLVTIPSDIVATSSGTNNAFLVPTRYEWPPVLLTLVEPDER